MIRHEGDKWVLYTRDGKKKLGEHDTKEQAIRQEQAILAAQARRLAKVIGGLIEAIKRKCKTRGKSKDKIKR